MKTLTVSGKTVRIIDLRPSRDELQVNIYAAEGRSVAKTIQLKGDTRALDDIAADLDLDVASALPDSIPPEPAAPDVPAFIDTIKAKIGDILQVNALMRQYPAFYPSIMAGKWNDVQSLVLDAQSNKILSDAQVALFREAFIQHNIPVDLDAH